MRHMEPAHAAACSAALSATAPCHGARHALYTDMRNGVVGIGWGTAAPACVQRLCFRVAINGVPPWEPLWLCSTACALPQVLASKAGDEAATQGQPTQQAEPTGVAKLVGTPVYTALEVCRCDPMSHGTCGRMQH